MDRMGFSHQRLDVYRRAVAAFASILKLTENSWWRERPLVLQLVRSASSVPLNIAEGADEHSPAEKAKFFRYARRSAAEADATLELLLQFPKYADSDIPNVRDELSEIGAILSALITRCEHQIAARKTH